MPTYFSRYVLWEVNKLFVIALVAMTSVFTLSYIVKEMVAAGLGPWTIVQLVPFALPIALQFALPATLLFGCCAVFGAMSADNEITAVKSVGVSPLRVMTPAMILALLLSPVTVWLNDLAVSWGRPGVNRVVMFSLEEIVYSVLRSQRSYSSDRGLSIFVEDVDQRWLIRPTITIFNSDSGRPISVRAERAQLQLNPQRETLALELIDSHWDNGKDYLLHYPGSQRLELPLDQAARKGRNRLSASELPMRMISGEIQEQQEIIRLHQQRLVARQAMGLATGQISLLDDEPASSSRQAITDGKRYLSRLSAEPWRRWALGFSCFCFVWVGVPLAIHLRTADYWTSFGAVFLPILLIYYPLFLLGLDQAKTGKWPGVSVWLGNAVLLVFGAWLIRKIHRH